MGLELAEREDVKTDKRRGRGRETFVVRSMVGPPEGLAAGSGRERPHARDAPWVAST